MEESSCGREAPVSSQSCVASSQCVKCKSEKPKIRVQFSDYCKSCFLTLATYKWYSHQLKSLGAQAVKKMGHATAMEVMGDAASMTCLYCLISREMTVWTTYLERQQRNQELSLVPSVITVILLKNTKELKEAVMNIYEKCLNVVREKYPNIANMKYQPQLRLVHVPLAKALSLTRDAIFTGNIPFTWEINTIYSLEATREEETVLDSLQRSCSATVWHRLSNLLEERLLLCLARHFQCSRLMRSTTCTELATLLLDAVTEGRGGEVSRLSLALDTASPYSESLQLVRPCRDLSSKECAYFTHCLGIPVPGIELKKSPCSMHQLTAQLMVGLDAQFPATASAVVRASAKLEQKSRLEPCRVCLGWNEDASVCYACTRLVSELSLIWSPLL